MEGTLGGERDCGRVTWTKASTLRERRRGEMAGVGVEREKGRNKKTRLSRVGFDCLIKCQPALEHFLFSDAAQPAWA